MKDLKERKLTRNRAQCGVCKDIVESTFRHDFVQCKCGAIFVDGGLAYIRRGGKLENIIEMCEWSDGEKDVVENSTE